jgi:crossover junction endodeoxyribonuclease RuvC
MRVLGVDPGTMVTGWAIIECDKRDPSRLASGTIRIGRGEIAGRLAAIYSQLSQLIAQYSPDVLSLERHFMAANVQSAFRLGEARGVAMAAAAASSVTLCEYSPATIKKSVVGYGRADKSQVQAAVSRLFRLTSPPGEDEADALAAAACHAFHRSYDTRIAQALESSNGRTKVRRPT